VIEEEQSGKITAVDFLLFDTLPDENPIIARRKRRDGGPLISLPLSNAHIEALCQRSNIHEVLWNFGRFDDKRRLTLKQNPHFYRPSDLPILCGAYVDIFKTDPIDDFQHPKICVLIDRPGRVFLNTGRNTRAFGNIWTPREAIVFKGPQI